MCAVSVAFVVRFALQKESPAVVVQRFCATVKAEEWDKSYDLIEWGKPAQTEKAIFIAGAQARHGQIMIERYVTKQAIIKDNSATVNVNVTSTIVDGKSRKTSDKVVSISCKYSDKGWQVQPNFPGGLLGTGLLATK